MLRSPVHTLLCAAILCGVLLGQAAPAQAWWGDVHSTICAAAYQLTSDAGRALVDRYGAETEDAAPWPASCSWADEVRYSTHKDTYGYHFVNVPRAAARTDVSMVVDCAAHDCVQQAVKRYAIYLAAPNTRERDRQDALRFLAHFIADLHQPLHAGYAEDLGGNRIQVRVPGEEEPSYRLHAVWDGIVARRAGLGGPDATNVLLRYVASVDTRTWPTLDFNGAVQDSYDLARLYAYVLPDGRPLTSGIVLQDNYFDSAAPVATEQIARAAVRLAHVLDVIGRGDFDPVTMN